MTKEKLQQYIMGYIAMMNCINQINVSTVFCSPGLNSFSENVLGITLHLLSKQA